MAIINSENMTPGQLVANLVTLLKLHRQVLEQLNDYAAWASGVAASDLEQAPFNFSAVTANGILSAAADAHAEYLIHTTGQAPATYPQVPTAAPGPYVYAASQNALIGYSLT